MQKSHSDYVTITQVSCGNYMTATQKLLCDCMNGVWELWGNHMPGV